MAFSLLGQNCDFVTVLGIEVEQLHLNGILVYTRLQPAAITINYTDVENDPEGYITKVADGHFEFRPPKGLLSPSVILHGAGGGSGGGAGGEEGEIGNRGRGGNGGYGGLSGQYTVPTFTNVEYTRVYPIYIGKGGSAGTEG